MRRRCPLRLKGNFFLWSDSASSAEGETKEVDIRIKKKNNINNNNNDLSVGLLCFRMFCVDQTFLLCTRWSFLWHVLTYCMCYLLDTFLKCLILHRVAPYWRVCTDLKRIKVIFMNVKKKNRGSWFMSRLNFSWTFFGASVSARRTSWWYSAH